MKTSMAYRLFRLYFNSHSGNFRLFGNRVHNPMNGTTTMGMSHGTAAIVRGIAVIILGWALIASIL